MRTSESHRFIVCVFDQIDISKTDNFDQYAAGRIKDYGIPLSGESIISGSVSSGRLACEAVGTGIKVVWEKPVPKVVWENPVPKPKPEVDAGNNPFEAYKKRKRKESAAAKHRENARLKREKVKEVELKRDLERLESIRIAKNQEAEEERAEKEREHHANCTEYVYVPTVNDLIRAEFSRRRPLDDGFDIPRDDESFYYEEYRGPFGGLHQYHALDLDQAYMDKLDHYHDPRYEEL